MNSLIVVQNSMENITKDDESNGIDIFDELSPNTLLALCKFFMQREENFNDNNLMENWQASFSYFWVEVVFRSCLVKMTNHLHLFKNYFY